MTGRYVALPAPKSKHTCVRVTLFRAMGAKGFRAGLLFFSWVRLSSKFKTTPVYDGRGVIHPRAGRTMLDRHTRTATRPIPHKRACAFHAGWPAVQPGGAVDFGSFSRERSLGVFFLVGDK